MLILKEGNEVANNFGFGTAIRTMLKGLDSIGAYYTHNKKDKFDVILANDFLNAEQGVKVKKETGKPLIAVIHLSSSSNEERELIGACDGVIVFSNMMIDFMKKIYPNINVPILVSEIGIDTDLFTYEDSKRDNFLLYAGRTKSGNKNFFDVIEKSLKENIELKVAGDIAVDIPNVNSKYLQQIELIKLYRKAKCHIISSIHDPFGLVTLEAMACGCPVIVSIKAGVEEVLNEDVAIFFDPTKEYKLKDLMDKADKANFDPKKLSNYARQFTPERFVRSLLSKVNKIKEKHLLEGIDIEIKRGDYDRFDLTDKVVLDIGAYCGETAEHFVNRGAKTVYAIEPLSSFSKIPYTNKIKPLRAGIGEKDEKVFIDDMFNTGEIRLSDISGGKNLILIYSLKTLVEKLGIKNAFLKVDIEGDEDFLFSVDRNTLHKFDCMIIETHERKGNDYIGLGLSAFLIDNGFKVSLESHGKNVKMIYAKREKVSV